ncbi:hypothetical protein BB559_007386, partial [Furculomyces boomerangus]
MENKTRLKNRNPDNILKHLRKNSNASSAASASLFSGFVAKKEELNARRINRNKTNVQEGSRNIGGLLRMFGAKKTDVGPINANIDWDKSRNALGQRGLLQKKPTLESELLLAKLPEWTKAKNFLSMDERSHLDKKHS